MMGQELQALNDIAMKVSRLEVMQETNTKAIGEMASSVNRLVDKLDASDDIAKEARDKAASAHHRITELNVDLKEIKTGHRWLLTTTVSIGGLFVAAVGLIWKLAV